MSNKFIFGICCLSALGVFFLAFGYTGYTEADFFNAMMNHLLPGSVAPHIDITVAEARLKSAGFSKQEIWDYQSLLILRTKFIGILFITAGAVTLVSAFLFYRQNDKQ